MKYAYLDEKFNKENIELIDSDKINRFLLKNNESEIRKAVEFLNSDEKFLYVHGFMGTGKRQFINYILEYLSDDVIKLEYYCKQATVCDDILLAFTDYIDQQSISKAINLNTKITTLGVKFKQQISSIKKPFLIVLHSYDDVLEENAKRIKELIKDVIKEENVKLVVSTRALKPSMFDEVSEDRKIFLKAFTKEIFKEFIISNEIEVTDRVVEDFYKYTRGYYYYLALAVKIIQAMKISLSEFLLKYNQSGMSFDSFLGITYINLIPTTIRNFFWFLRTVRHGMTLNALAVFELYDDFSIEYLKTNLMVFQVGDILYVQDYFLQKIDISIPKKTEVKLHKYIIGIYENQLKAPLKDRAIMISRQAMRAEIEYHNQCIAELENGESEAKAEFVPEEKNEQKKTSESSVKEESLSSLLEKAAKFSQDKKYTEAIEAYIKILDFDKLDLSTLVEVRLKLADLYKKIENYQLSSHFYELVETYYRQQKEMINLNYLYYDISDLYFKMYKHERAIETIKKVIYSVDTPQSLFVGSCTLLGNIYADLNNSTEAYSYYKKAIDSLDDNVKEDVLYDLYFKYALANDDSGNFDIAFEFYNKCIALKGDNPYKASAYSNLASCYLENESYDDAMDCFEKAYNIEKKSNNYEGIYYNVSHIAKILMLQRSSKALKYLLEAKKSAEFINEGYSMVESMIALGDYYYNNPKTYKEALCEYFKANNLAEHISREVDLNKIKLRINDMKLRMNEEDFVEVKEKYDKQN